MATPKPSATVVSTVDLAPDMPGYQLEYKPGEVVTESRDVIHWGENRGTSKVVSVSVDIIKKP